MWDLSQGKLLEMLNLRHSRLNGWVTFKKLLFADEKKLSARNMAKKIGRLKRPPCLRSSVVANTCFPDQKKIAEDGTVYNNKLFLFEVTTFTNCYSASF